MSRLTRDGTAEPVSRDQILRHARGQGNIIFSCSADHEQDWQPYPVDPYIPRCGHEQDWHLIGLWLTCCVTVVSSVEKATRYYKCVKSINLSMNGSKVVFFFFTFWLDFLLFAPSCAVTERKESSITESRSVPNPNH